MNLLHRLQFPTLVGFLFILMVFSSCEEELTTIGDSVIGGQPFSTGTEVYDVFAFNNNINAVQTNKLGVYQLGNFSDPIFGKTEAQIMSQIQLSVENPSFGVYSQTVEDSADTDDSVTTIEENESVTEVYLYIPYLTKSSVKDTDGDGVSDDFDKKIEEDDDYDLDGRTNNEERIAGTDPLDPKSVDADLDGINDVDPKIEIVKDNFAKRVDIDSIYGNRNAPFTLNVKRSTFFLRDFDPQTNFTEAEKYYSNIDYSSFITDDLVIDDNGIVPSVDEFEILIEEEDDPSTEDVNENLTRTKLNPGIRIPLKNSFFQDNILNKEGSSELLNQANFKEYIRGLQLSIDATDDIMVLLDLSKASITMTYEYDSYNTNSTTTDTSDDTIDKKEKDFTFAFLGATFTGNAVNTFVNENYPTEVANALASTEQAEKIYIKGGAGTYAKINLFSTDEGISSSIINEIKANNWIINEAKLVFYVDQAANGNLSEEKPPRLYLFNTETNQGVYNAFNEFSPDTTSPFGTYLNYDAFLEESNSGDKYTIRITDHINNIIQRDSANVTLGLTTTPNINISGALNAKIGTGGDQELPAASIISPLGTVLYANHPSSEDMKLKLQIDYSEAN